MCPMVNTDDLCDAREVAALLGLSHANSVFGYLRRYTDLPRPVVNLGPGRVALWLRPEVEAWCERRPRRSGRVAGEWCEPNGAAP
jgi:predicted DNA-binding transcriptional regulator AlpA